MSKRNVNGRSSDLLATLPRDAEWAQLAEGTRQAAVQALAARDRVEAVMRDGDPRYGNWWGELAHASAQLASRARLVQIGLRAHEKARQDAFDHQRTPRSPVPGVPITVRRCTTVRRR